MQELIKINKNSIGAKEVNSINARDLWQKLEIKQEFASWIKKQIISLGLKENTDFIRFDIKVKGDNKGYGNKTLIEYALILDISKHIALASRTDKGREIRNYFIEVEKQGNMPKALSLAELLEENTKVIKQLDEKVVHLETKIQNDKPKIVFANSVSQSYSSILIGQFAKAISKDGFSIGQNRLFTWLRENGYLCQNGANYNQPKQKYIDNKYFEIIERTVNSPDGNTRLTMTTKVTGKGQVALADKILASGVGLRLVV